MIVLHHNNFLNKTHFYDFKIFRVQRSHIHTLKFSSGNQSINKLAQWKYKLYFIQKRTMMRNLLGAGYAHFTAKPILLSLSKKEIPIHTKGMALSAHKFKKSYAQEICHERDRQDISHHEGSHILVFDTRTNTYVCILTSSKGKNLPPDVYIEKISSEKFNGSFIPLIDKITKQPILDADGKMILDPNKGGQFAAVFPVQRTMSLESRSHLLSKDELEKLYPGLEKYLNKHQSQIEKAVDKGHAQNKTKERFSKKLGGKDDEPL